MKFFRKLSFVLILVFSMGCCVYADNITDSAIEEPMPEIFETETTSSGITVVVNNPDNSSAISALTDYIASRDSENSVYSLGNESLQLRSVNVSNETITASDANGFKAVILGLLGDYTTIITDYTYQTQQGYTQHSIDVTPDWSWVCSSAIFVVVVYCSMKMIGGLLCSR